MASTGNENVLVTGGTGFLGQALGKTLPGAVCLGRRDLDLTDGPAVLQWFKEHRPEVVVHAAARVGGITANITAPADFLLDNVRMDANICAALRAYPVRHFICMLSTCMYPDRLADEHYPLSEAMLDAGPPAPTNAAYAQAKRTLWQATRALYEQYGVPYTALVLTNMYGPGDHYDDKTSHFLTAAIRKIEEARRQNASLVTFFGTGTALRQYIYVDDVAHLVREVIRHGPRQQIYNVAGEQTETIGTLAQEVADGAGYTGDVVFSCHGPDGQYRKDVSTQRLRMALPQWWDLQIPLHEGLAKTFAWYRQKLDAPGES